ncbi:unnamed protein product [Symbiodinium pilosum]|uniref:Uncharacterized protein n=1 Tax=Symbiodinium pilosum TaxID=2952 RepID=A0A812JGA4_SYMPI|nr:unnamed protein product [Symbiodinium pilosum]
MAGACDWPLGHGVSRPTAFLLGWLWRDPNGDLAPEALLQRLHPTLRAEIFKRPRLKKSFEDDIQAVFNAYKNQASVDEFRELVDGRLGRVALHSLERSRCFVGML